MKEENEISRAVVDGAIKVHRALGPGLLESAYQASLAHLLMKEGYKVELEKPQPVKFQEVELDTGYRLDMLINEKVIIELKAVESLNDIHMAQILTYLKLSKCKLGMILNFNVRLMKSGIKRVVL